MAPDFDVIVDVNPCFFPFGKPVRILWQGVKGRPINGLKQGFSGALEFLKGFCVKFFQKNADRFIELAETKESLIPKPCQYPAFDDLDRGFYLGLIFGFSHPGRDDGSPIVSGHIKVGLMSGS